MLDKFSWLLFYIICKDNLAMIKFDYVINFIFCTCSEVAQLHIECDLTASGQFVFPYFFIFIYNMFIWCF